MSNEQKHAGGSHGHYKLEAWKRARELVLSVYSLTQTFPKEEMFGLAAQLRRAAVSIPRHIAEGGRNRIEQNFSAEKMVDGMVRTYEEVLVNK